MIYSISKNKRKAEQRKKEKAKKARKIKKKKIIKVVYTNSPFDSFIDKIIKNL